MSNTIPKYSRSQYYDYAKEKFDSVDWSQVASDAAVVAENVSNVLYGAAAEVATVTANATLSAAKVARSVVAFEGPEPLSTLVAMTDKSCFPTFIDRNSLERRKLLFKELQEKYSDKIPIIVEKAPGSRIDVEPCLTSKRYLVPFKVTLGSFIQSVRLTLKIPSYESIWLTTTFGKNILGAISNYDSI